jgi:hypothetical protein
MLIGGTEEMSVLGSTSKTFFFNFENRKWTIGPNLKEKRCHKVWNIKRLNYNLAVLLQITKY